MEAVAEKSLQEMYCYIFKEYPDVLDVKQVSRILNVSTKTVYKLIQDNTLSSLKVGREFRVPKIFLLKYIKISER